MAQAGGSGAFRASKVQPWLGIPGPHLLAARRPPRGPRRGPVELARGLTPLGALSTFAVLYRIVTNETPSGAHETAANAKYCAFELNSLEGYFR